MTKARNLFLDLRSEETTKEYRRISSSSSRYGEDKVQTTTLGCFGAYPVFFNTLFEMEFLSSENLMLAYRNAIKSRKNTYEVYLFNQNLENNLQNILHDLQTQRYIHSPYRTFSLCDSKKRYISSPIFRDHILHHMICNICYDVLDKRMIYASFATRTRKGLHIGLKYLTKNLQRYIWKGEDLRYLKMDISKYFYAISHDLLKKKIAKYIHNPDLLYAINLTIDSYQTSAIFDSLFSPDGPYRQNKQKGLPIGALYSQLFANFFLSEIDRYIVQQLKPKIYLRYMDDLLIVDTKSNLLNFRTLVNTKIIEHDLLVVPKKVQINSLNFGLPFLGFKLQSKNKKIHISVNTTNKKKFWKTVDTIYNLDISSFERGDQTRIQSVFESRKGIFKHTGNYEKYLQNLPQDLLKK